FFGDTNVRINLSAFMTREGFYNKIINYTATTKKELYSRIDNEKTRLNPNSYYVSEWNKINGTNFEVEAYENSDKKTPQYYWQKNYPWSIE
ncbi:MAG: hypothetical protein V1752_03295, partial [Candidatus Firestonebacteria bacterium]